MASKLPAVKGAAYTFRAVLFAQTGNQIKTSPTIAAGDFQTSKDGGAFGNLATIPAESPASSGQVLVTLSTAEMNGDEIMVRAIDASGDEWHSQAWAIHTAAQTFDTTDGVADTILADTAELQTDDVPGLIAALNDLSAADVNAEVDTALSDYDAPTKAELDSAVSPLATAVAVADLPTNAELAVALAGADDATLAAIAALNDITVADIWSGLGDTEKNAIADAILSRSVFHVEDTAGVHSLTELILAAFESSIADTTWQINQTDGVTSFNVRTVTVDANADPITGVEGGN
jgi:hypothetical protein